MSDQKITLPRQPYAGRLIRTKLFIPRVRSSLVVRQQLEQELNHGLESKIILVTAPPGFGKTTLVSSWIQGIAKRKRVAWLSLEPTDNEPVRFWSYLIAALQMVDHLIGETALGMLRAPQPATFEAIIGEIINDLVVYSKEIVLVLDDYHTITDTTIHADLVSLIEHAPPEFHICLISRIDPPFPLSLWRARRDLFELNADDLRFDSMEMRAFFQLTAGLDLEANDLIELENITEGWVAGMQLAALSIENPQEVTGFIQDFSGSHRHVFDYLAQEVLTRQSPETRLFLLNTSILERLESSLCDAVLQEQNSQSILNTLDAANLFIVPLDHNRIWYRYHHLFGEFLRASLAREASSAQIALSHTRASQWFLAHDFPGEAISHAILAGNPAEAAAIIERYSEEMFRTSDLHTFLNWLGLIPHELVSKSIGLSITAGWAHLATGHPESATPHLLDIERVLGVEADGSLESLEQPVEIRHILGQVAMIRSSLVFNRMDAQNALAMTDLAQRYIGQKTDVISFNRGVGYKVLGRYTEATEALIECIELSKLAGNHHLLPMAISHLAEIHLVQGKLNQAEADYQEALRLVQHMGTPSPLAGSAFTGLGLLMIERDQLALARMHLEKGLELGRKWSNWEALISGIRGLTRIKLINGDIPGAQKCLDQLKQQVQSIQVDWAEAACQTQVVEIALSTANVPILRDWLQTSRPGQTGEIAVVQVAVALLQAKAHRLLGNFNEAEQLLLNIITASEKDECWGWVIESCALLAVISQETNRDKLALKYLERALTLAEPEEYRRVFIEHGVQMEQLLRKVTGILEGQTSRSLQQYIVSLLNDFQGNQVSFNGGSRRSDDLARLTEREIRVLALMAGGLTNQQIADELVVSLSTVKTHVRNILNKLAVNNRTQATSMARQLGLI